MNEDEKTYNDLIKQTNEIINEINILHRNLRKKLGILKEKQDKISEGVRNYDDDDDESSLLISSPPKTIKKDKTTLREDLKFDEDSLNSPVGIRQLAIRDKTEIDKFLGVLSNFKRELITIKTKMNPDEDEEPPTKRPKKSDGKKKRSKSKRRLKSKSKSKRRLKYSRRWS